MPVLSKEHEELLWKKRHREKLLLESQRGLFSFSPFNLQDINGRSQIWSSLSGKRMLKSLKIRGNVSRLRAKPAHSVAHVQFGGKGELMSYLDLVNKHEA
jgi:hypothetical protein